jgi:hypothetical protein
LNAFVSRASIFEARSNASCFYERCKTSQQTQSGLELNVFVSRASIFEARSNASYFYERCKTYQQTQKVELVFVVELTLVAPFSFPKFLLSETGTR